MLLLRITWLRRPNKIYRNRLTIENFTLEDIEHLPEQWYPYRVYSRPEKKKKRFAAAY